MRKCWIVFAGVIGSRFEMKEGVGAARRNCLEALKVVCIMKKNDGHWSS